MKKEKPNKKPITHIEVFVEDKEVLEAIRDEEGYASIKITLSKILKRGKKQTTL